jgi:hypothetical protein
LKTVAGVTDVREESPGSFAIDTDGRRETTSAIAALAVSQGLLEIREETLNLEGLFLKVTTSEENQLRAEEQV